ncbi:hypothetical protein QTP86_012535 [Hemibagrus guttatus]|nr:hypothetical protein QTP86_012535 [Hemibagrus guttatus]
MSQKPDSLSGVWDAEAPAHDRYPKHIAPDPYAPSCGWWAYGKVGLRRFFGLCPAESCRQRLGHQALACVPQPQAWLQGGAPVTPVRATELNLMKDQKLSLMEDLHFFFKEIKETNISSPHKVLFIFDGLDECRFPLDFQNTVRVCDVAESASVNVLLINPIKGNLLPSALIWITSRPAAADQIPSEWFNRVTEVRGFNDPQKEEYFRKRISDQSLSNRIITHLKSLRSLYIMCHIPVFCWISATVLERLLGEADSGEIPKTLTQMYTHFLIIQTNMNKKKYTESGEADEEMVLKLEKGCTALASVLSSESSSLRELDLSGNRFKDSGVMCLSAGLESPHCNLETLRLCSCRFSDEGCSALTSALRLNPSHLRNLDLSRNYLRDSGVKSLSAVLENPHCKLETLRLEYCGVTDEGCAALISSLRSNSSHLRELDLSKNYLRDSGVKSLSAGLENPHCKLETLKFCSCDVTDEGCAALTSALRSNPSHLRKLDLSENKLTDSGVKSLSAVLENPHCKLETLRLRGCEISGEGCAALTSALISNPSHMRELNLSWNKLTDSGVKSLSAVLVNPHCKLDTLRLCDCGISGEGCAALTSALISNPSHLRKLDLSWNYLRDSGVESLSAVLENPHCKLDTLSRGGRRVHRQREKRKGKGRELADMMERRKVDILSVQETRWKGSKARSIGAGFKLFYYGVDSKRNGVGVVLKEEFVRNILEVGCELEEKERFWSELDEVMESIPTGERVVMGADFNGHVGEGNTGDEEKREEHRVTYKSGGRSTQKKRQKLRQALGGQVLLPDDWETTAEVIRETGRKVLGVSSGRRKEDKETWWWNEEVQDSIQRKRLAKKKWDMDRTEENRQEYKELQRRVKREVSKAKQKAYDELYTRLDTREGQKDLFRLARQRDQDGKDVQQVRVIKDRDGRVLTSEESVQRRWKEYFEELMNEENERVKRVEGVNSVEQKVDKIRKDEVRKALKRMKSGKAVGPDDIPVEVWKCLGEAAVEFLASLFNRVLENLEKAYDRVPREELWYCMRKSGVAEKYVRVVQDMYERSRTVVRCAVGQTEEFNVEVGLHQGSALSPFLFAIVMDQLSEEVRQESPWTMMFADDIVICSESTEQVEENLERWRFALERRGMKVSRSKTEYMCVNEREGSGTVRLQSEEVKKVQEFKYLGSTVQSNGECGKEVKKRVQAGWNEWRKVSGVLCDQKISARIKGKVYRTVVRAAMLYGLETVSLRLCSCEISDEGCSALTSALISNPSHLKQLDLSWNNLTDSGVKSLSAVLENPQCKLDTLSFRGGAAPLVASGGEFRQHLAPDRPPLGEFQTSARRTSSPRSRRSSVDIARCECSAVDVARSCCSAVDVAWSCGSAVDVIRLCGSAVDVIRLCGSAVDLVRRFRSAVDVASDPLALPSGPLLPPLVSLLLLTPPTCLALILVPPTCLALVLASPHSPCFCFSLPPQVPRPAPRSPHRPLYVPSSSPGPLAGPDFLGGAREQLLVFSDVGDPEAGVPACGGGHGGIPQ